MNNDDHIDDSILRMAFQFWHKDRIERFGYLYSDSVGEIFMPSVYSDFISMPENVRKPYIDKAIIESREQKIEKIIKKDDEQH